MHYSWLLIFALVAASATRVGARHLPGLSPSAYLLVGFSFTVVLFACLLMHELAHAVVARRHGMEIHSIVLFVFGGVAQAKGEPPTPEAEFAVAAAGPATTLLIAISCFALWHLLPRPGGALVRILRFELIYLAVANALLLGFNLIPAFPLDGGRLLRSALWRVLGRRSIATTIAARLGHLGGLAMIVIGVVGGLSGGHLLDGIWLALIGSLLALSARAALEQAKAERLLETLAAAQVARVGCPVLPYWLPVAGAFAHEDIGAPWHFLLVSRGPEIIGIASRRRLLAVPLEQWAHATLADVMEPLDERNMFAPGEPLRRVLERLRRSGREYGLVVDARTGRAIGVVSREDGERLAGLLLE